MCVSTARQFQLLFAYYAMRIISLFLLSMLLSGCNKGHHDQRGSAGEFIRGVYGNPGALLKGGYRLDSLGVNAVFVRSASLNRSFFDTARAQGCKIFVEFPTLNGKEYLEDHPEAWPIDEEGEPSPPADWFLGICPTHEGFKAHRIQELKTLLAEYEVDGIFMDYFHLHAQFETPEPILPETCFCDRCTSLFASHVEKDIQGATIRARAEWILDNLDSEWRSWRSHLVNTWAEDLGAVVKEYRPNALLGVYHCAWYAKEYDVALYRILGIDVGELAARVDVLSPMLYHEMMNRPATWVSEYIKWLDELTQASIHGRPKIWPIVQAHNKPGIITAEEFREVMVNGAHAPSSGIMMFSEVSLLQDPDKIEVMKELYHTFQTNK